MTKQELLELLKKARKQLKKYHVPYDEQTITLSIDTLEKALSEQPAIVSCKDCKYWEHTPQNTTSYWKPCDEIKTEPHYYCWCGERRTE